METYEPFGFCPTDRPKKATTNKQKILVQTKIINCFCFDYFTIRWDMCLVNTKELKTHHMDHKNINNTH